MRFLNELIRKKKAAHPDAMILEPADAIEPRAFGSAGADSRDPDLPHLRRPSNFDHFAANRPSEAPDVIAGSNESSEFLDEKPLSLKASLRTMPGQDSHEETDAEPITRQTDADVIIAREAFRDESLGDDTPEVLDDPQDDEMHAPEIARLDPMIADEIAPEDTSLEPASEQVAFVEDTSETQDYFETQDLPAEDAQEAPELIASEPPLRSQDDLDSREISSPKGDAEEDPAPHRAEPLSKVNIWDIEGTGETEDSFSDVQPGESAFAEPVVAPIPQDAPTQQRRTGRVRTRLLGFQRPEELNTDPFARSSQSIATNSEPTFPVGWMIVEKGPGRGAFFPLFNGVSKIGRGEDQAVRLDFGDMSVSRDGHAVVAYDDEQRAFFVGHGGKSNPVRLNGMPVLCTEPFNDGDRLRIGETTMRFVALCGPDFDWNDEHEHGERHVAAR